MAVNRANFWGHYGKGKGHSRQLPRGRRKFQALMLVILTTGNLGHSGILSNINKGYLRPNFVSIVVLPHLV